MTASKTSVLLVGGGNVIAGKEIMLITLARGLRKAGINVEVVTSIWGGKGEFVSQLRSEGFEFHRVRLGFISMTLSWRPIIWTLDQLRYWPSLVVGYLKAVEAAAPKAVIHTNWHHALLLAPFLSPRRDIYWSHEIIPKKRRYRSVFRAIANRVALVVCVSSAVARSLEALGIDPAKVVVIRNSLPLDQPLPVLESRKPMRLGIIGQIGAWKGHDDVLDALVILLSRSADVIVKIFGRADSEYADDLKRKAVALRVAERIEWMGFVSSQRDIYGQIDICLMPSRGEEAFGLAALEAGLNGRPVICSACGGLREIVLHGETGFLVEARHPEQLAAAVENFLRRPELVVTMGEAARRHVRKEFAYEKFVNGFRHAIDELGQRG